MKQEIAELWAADLESNPPQAFGTLKTHPTQDGPPGHCVVGRLCELHAQATNSVWMDDGRFFRYFGMSGCAEITVAIWAGLSSQGEGKVMRLNDAERLSFPEIAKFIRENWESL